MQKHYTLDQFQYITRHHEEHTAKEMSELLKLPIHVVTGIGYRFALPYKKVNRKRKESPGPEAKLKHVVPVSLLPDPEPVRSFKRPAAVYSNRGYLNTLKTYGE